MANERLFHKGHYNILAAQIKKNYPRIIEANNFAGIERRALEEFALSLAKRLKLDNPNFDPLDFLEHCSPDPELYPLQELWDEE